jgi:hypothetical protein
VTVPAPGVEFAPEGVNTAKVLFSAMNRQASPSLPSLDSTYVALEIGSDFLPGLKAFSWRCKRSAVA